jgi:hypothetical protein
LSEFNVEKLTWPYGKHAAFSIAVDDVHPESSDDPDGVDFGGNQDGGKFGFLKRLLADHPDLGITLFLVPSWEDRMSIPLWRYTKHLDPLAQVTLFRSRRLLKLARKAKTVRRYPEGRFRIDRESFRDWCVWLAELAGTPNYEVALHGLTHFGTSVESSSKEFFGLSFPECLRKLETAEEIVQNCGIPFVRGFRPPAWEIGKNLLVALIQRGYIFVAGSADYSSPVSANATTQGYGLKGVSLLMPEMREGLLVIPSNIEALDEFRVLRILEKGGLVVVDVHVAKTGYGMSHLSADWCDSASRLISRVKKELPKGVWFSKLGDIAVFFHASERCSVEVEALGKQSYSVEISNESDFPLRGVSLRSSHSLKAANSEDARTGVRMHSPNVISVDVSPRSTAKVQCIIASE